MDKQTIIQRAQQQEKAMAIATVKAGILMNYSDKLRQSLDYLAVCLEEKDPERSDDMRKTVLEVVDKITTVAGDLEKLKLCK